MLTTFSSYGAVGSRRQQEIISGLDQRPLDGPLSVSEIAKAGWTVDAWAPLDGRVANGGVRLGF